MGGDLPARRVWEGGEGDKDVPPALDVLIPSEAEYPEDVMKDSEASPNSRDPERVGGGGEKALRGERAELHLEVPPRSTEGQLPLGWEEMYPRCESVNYVCGAP